MTADAGAIAAEVIPAGPGGVGGLAYSRGWRGTRWPDSG